MICFKKKFNYKVRSLDVQNYTSTCIHRTLVLDRSSRFFYFHSFVPKYNSNTEGRATRYDAQTETMIQSGVNNGAMRNRVGCFQSRVRRFTIYDCGFTLNLHFNPVFTKFNSTEFLHTSLHQIERNTSREKRTSKHGIRMIISSH